MPYTEEVISRPFVGENRFLLVRDDICQKHHKQRLCKIITRVKFYFVDVFQLQVK